ncbi:BTB/POZ domain-containing protein 1-like [Clavelina lepadiformis]|uniref:BTB/POZ domain-containing protein 1-like n=1 Tax=Clavelina lepadiformis TaxID=159417 RepID=UPI004041CD06
MAELNRNADANAGNQNRREVREPLHLNQNRALDDAQPPAGIAFAIVGGNNGNAADNPGDEVAAGINQPAVRAPVVGAVAGVVNRVAGNPLHLVPRAQVAGERAGRNVAALDRIQGLGVGVIGVRPVVEGQPLYNWQATKVTLKERFQFLFNNELQADVYFLVGRGVTSQRIPAHRFVLSVGSAVFDAMFNSILATQSNEVEVPDVEPAAFLSLLRFLYTDEVLIGPETVMTTLYTAKKYAVPALESHCVDFLKKHLSSDNAFMLLTQARLFDEPQLATLCLECIDKHTREALSADGFTDIDYNTLVNVLERDTLGLREKDIFSAMERWAEAECNRQELSMSKENKRKALGDSISLVRFPLMNVEEFAQGPAQSGILTDREVVELFLYFTLNPKPRVRFSDRARCSITGKEYSVCRFLDVAERWGYSGTSDRIRFSVNRKIYLVGLGLYGAILSPSDYQVNIQVVSADNGTVLGQNDTGFSCDGSDKTFRVMFKRPIEIKPNQVYIACATLNGQDSYYGTQGQRRVTKDTPNDGQIVFTFTFAPGNNNGTSVEDGQIPELIYYT